MPDNVSIQKWRVLLTETLPYEVPLIFSNEKIFGSVTNTEVSEGVSEIIARLRMSKDRPTIPYVYQITKDDRRKTTLSVIHPLQQMQIAEFYDTYYQTMLDYCSKSKVSLRHPFQRASIFSKARLEREATLKSGLPHTVGGNEELEASRISSFFAYRRYNLLARYLGSSEFRSLEKRYKHLRTLDISKCFFNMYTHSVTWAVKGKAFAKRNTDIYSFEARFDKLMQRCNYNETNGIVVGPEVSRIFAEIILQQIDIDVIQKLKRLTWGKNYVFARYVDDYYVYANSLADIGSVSDCIESCLEAYKLFLNTQKTRDYNRPFVSEITLARNDLSQIFYSLQASLKEIASSVSAIDARRELRKFRFEALSIRTVVAKYGVSFSSLSGWLLSMMRPLLLQAVKIPERKQGSDVLPATIDLCKCIIEVIFYIISLDFRVRSTYTLCQLLVVLTERRDLDEVDGFDTLLQYVNDELLTIIDRYSNVELEASDVNVEFINIMITGAHCLGAMFLRSAAFKRVVSSFARLDKISYFHFIGIKFCLLKEKALYGDVLSEVNAKVRDQITKSVDGIFDDTETYLLFCDYLSSPDIPIDQRLSLFTKMLGGNRPATDLEQASAEIGFADWEGVNILHLLARKELRPAYE